MSKLDLSEAGRRYLFLKTELKECPDLANDEEFMRRYHHLHKMYKHQKNRQNLNQSADRMSYGLIRVYNDDGVI